MTSEKVFECVELDQRDGVAVVRFKDEKVMDPERIEQLGQELLSIAEDHEGPMLRIDFERVRFFSSAAINKLIVLEKRMGAAGKKLQLNNLQTEVRDLFSFTNLDKLFDICEGPADISGDGVVADES